MFLLQQIRQIAAASPGKLAVVSNGSPLTYDRFWRLIVASRETLAPGLPTRGLALLAVHGLLDGWLLSLALRSLGLDTAVIAAAEQADLFEGLPVACVITLTSENWPDIGGLAGAIRLSLDPPSAQDVDDAGPPPPVPARRCGGHILLTSGTTGTPKKVLTRIGSTAADSDMFGDGVVQMFAATVRNVFNLGLWTGSGYWAPVWTWCGTGAVVMHDGGDFHRALAWPGITHSVGTPQYYAYLMDLPEGAFPYCPDMTVTVMAGALSPELARQIRRRLAPIININLSSTEVGGWGRVLVTGDDDLIWYWIDPGRRVQIVDEADQVLPHGVLGRVRVALAKGAACGYVGDPASSAQTFQDGWFYSGDLGVLNGAGKIALYGRVADVIYLNGDKIAAGPWERAIQDALGCEGVCLLSGRWRGTSEQLHVFIESRRVITQGELTAALRATVRGFDQVEVHKLDAMPRTDLGKVRRIELARRLQAGELETSLDPEVSGAV